MKRKIAIIGGGFSGLTISHYLNKNEYDISIFEKEKELGGLASSFEINGIKIEKFYHHWFSNDHSIISLIEELKLEENIQKKQTNTGFFFANKIFKLSKPLDLLNFKLLTWPERINFALSAIKVKFIKNYKKLESSTAKEWLIKLSGYSVYKKIWEPLLIGKFGEYYSEISAVWIWSKLKLRGGSRGKKGQEQLFYYNGGFSNLINSIEKKMLNSSVKIYKGYEIININKKSEKFELEIKNINHKLDFDLIICTLPLPIISYISKNIFEKKYLEKLNSFKYLSNICLILVLEKKLSDTYWLNVNDVNFPFVGIIEHTNFDDKEKYGGKNIVYLSKYLPKSSNLYKMNKIELLNFSIPYIQQMFPSFNSKDIIESYLWKADWSQPIITKFYSKKILDNRTPLKNFFICSMAQIYPEDRGTNYSVKYGKEFVRKYLS